MAKGPPKPHIPDFRKVTRTVSRVARDTALELIREWAGEELQAFRQKILNQDFESFETHPLSEGWVARKLAANRDTRVMIATQHYVDSIQLFQRTNDDGSITVHVGFHYRAQARNLKGQTVPVRLYELGAIHEKGSAKANIPARPHWGPHASLMKAKAPEKRKAIAREIVKRSRNRLKKELKT